MVNQPLQLDLLEIVGYADALPEGKGPAVVPPVFRNPADPDHCFVPPFRIGEDRLIGPQCVSWAQIHDLVREGTITLFPEALRRPAQPGYRLWVDAAGQVHYERASEATKHLRNLFREHIDAASVALGQGRLDEAEDKAGIALAADATKLEPRAFLAACHALRGEPKHVLVMKDSALADGHSPEGFAWLVERYVDRLPVEAWNKLSFEAVRSACSQAGVDLRQRFDLPRNIMPFIGPALRDAQVRDNGNSFKIRCAGPDAEFLGEFLRLFKHNLLATVSAGQAVEVVRKAYRAEKGGYGRAMPPGSRGLDDYFNRLGGILAETGVLWALKQPGYGRLHPHWCAAFEISPRNASIS
jgi:hypothetical protein